MPAQSTAKIILANLKTACASCSLRELCLPFGLASLDMQKLDGIIHRRRRMRVHEHVYRAGDSFRSLYAIRSGFFKTYELNRDGREQISGFHMPGELIGLDAISSEKHVCGAVALDESEICEIPFCRLEELFHDIPMLQHRFHQLMSREITEDHHQMMVLGTMRADQRLAVFLLSLSERLKTRGHSPTSIHLSMSREEIGNYLGLKLETVSRMFSKFQEDGLIYVERRNLVIKDREGLQRLTE